MPIPALLPTYSPYPLLIERGLGDRLWDAEGKEWIDFYGGHCVCSTGHCHPRVVEAIREQAGRLLFYSAAGRLGIREEAAERLVRYTGGRADSVFFVNSGAEANENALKLALKLTGRTRLVAFKGGWHGRTSLALSVTDDPPLHAGLQPALMEVERLPVDDLPALDHVDWNEVAGAILEPIQSMAGVRVPDPGWLTELRRRTAEAGALLIFDEVQTGFGRLGAPFAAHRFGIQPDMIACAKGIASGFPMGALLLRAEVAQQIKPSDLGSTFGGGPLACAALIATLDVLEQERLAERAQVSGERLGQIIREAGFAAKGLGLLLGLDAGEQAPALKKHLVERRILVGGSHNPNVLRLMPPLNLSGSAIDAFAQALREFPR